MDITFILLSVYLFGVYIFVINHVYIYNYMNVSVYHAWYKITYVI